MHAPLPEPRIVSAPQGVRLIPRLTEDALPEALALLEGTYWNEGIAPAARARALLESTAWVGARDPSGALVAMARAERLVQGGVDLRRGRPSRLAR